jgi:hypothetical protein
MSSSLTLSPFLPVQPEDAFGKHPVPATPPYQMPDFPELQCGQYAVFRTELLPDGSPLLPDNQYYLDSEDGNSRWRVFDSFEEAHASAIKAVVANPFEQCAIFNDSRQQIHTIRNGQPVPLEVLLAQKSPKTWWQVWK